MAHPAPVLLAALALLAGQAALAPAAVAQGAPRPLLPNIPIPAEPSRPDPATQVVRKVVLTQIGAEGEPVGARLEMTCPASGCQGMMTLPVDGRPEQFSVTVTFVGRGTYVNLEPRTLGSARVVEYATGRTGPAFIPTRGRETVSRDTRYVVARDGSARMLNRDAGRTDPNVLSDGNVFTRKQEGDLVLRTEVQVQPQPR